MRLIQSYADAQAKLRPKAKAIVLGQDELTYEEIDRRSNSLARELQQRGCRRGDRVGLLMSKSPTAIVSILSVLKADCIATPLDPESPAPRLMKILDSSEPRLLMTDASAEKTIAELRSHSANVEAFNLEESAAFPTDPIPYQNCPENPAYLLYTSGSTGVPKGVPVTHRSISHFVDWAISYFGLTPQDRISGHPPLNFDLSVFDIFGTFAGGATLYPVPAMLNLSAAGMAEFIRSSELTQWFSVPSALNYMAKFDTVRENDFPKLKRILWCGEVLPTTTLRYWMQRLPEIQFTNLYGPTEATIASSYYTIPSLPEENDFIPIGRPCPGEMLHVLDATFRVVPPDTLGDLYIGGVGLSPGYWNDEVKTNAAFYRWPNSADRIYKTGDLAKVGRDGLIYFSGRADSQIKSRGFRIELGEIEAALHRIADLKESAVVAIPTNDFEGSLICCAFAPADHAQITTIRLREMLRRTIPSYMLPGRWMSLDRLPKTTNGKIDRPRLKELFCDSARAATPRNDSEVKSIEV